MTFVYKYIRDKTTVFKIHSLSLWDAIVVYYCNMYIVKRMFNKN